MQNYTSKLPPYVCGGEGCTGGICEIVSKEHAKNIIVITDKGVRAAGLTDALLRDLENAGAKSRVMDCVIPEPSYGDVQSIADEIERFDGDLLVAVGGGSVMDCAKLCSVLRNADYTVKDLLDDPSKAKKGIGTVMIPTTCGTGSEATCNAIVAVPEQSVKVGIVSDQMIPDYVFLDPVMIKGLPPSIVAATGVDALAHAVECYTSNKANPLSDVYALASAKMIFQNIRQAYKDPDDMEAKANMLIGAFYGGAAITASGTTAVHALSYPLGGKFHIAHGVSNAILFAHVMEFNMDACVSQLASICDAIRPELFGKSDTEKAGYVIGEIADIVRFTNIPTDLSAFGVGVDDLDFLVEAAGKVTRLLNNNRKALTSEDIRNIYKKVL